MPETVQRGTSLKGRDTSLRARASASRGVRFAGEALSIATARDPWRGASIGGSTRRARAPPPVRWKAVQSCRCHHSSRPRRQLAIGRLARMEQAPARAGESTALRQAADGEQSHCPARMTRGGHARKRRDRPSCPRRSWTGRAGHRPRSRPRERLAPDLSQPRLLRASTASSRPGAQQLRSQGPERCAIVGPEMGEHPIQLFQPRGQRTRRGIRPRQGPHRGDQAAQFSPERGEGGSPVPRRRHPDGLEREPGEQTANARRRRRLRETTRHVRPRRNADRARKFGTAGVATGMVATCRVAAGPVGGAGAGAAAWGGVACGCDAAGGVAAGCVATGSVATDLVATGLVAVSCVAPGVGAVRGR